MGQNSAKVFNPPQSYGQANVSQVSQVTPQGIAPSTTLLPDQAGAGLGVTAPATPAQVNNGRQNGGVRGKFFSDDFDPALFGKKKPPVGPGVGPKFPNPAPPVLHPGIGDY